MIPEINPKFAEYEPKQNMQKLSGDYATQKPYPHILLLDFFTNSFAHEIRKALLQSQFTLAEKDLFSFYHTKELTQNQHPVFKKLRAVMGSIPVISFLKRVTGQKLSGGFDMHGHLFLQGHYLLYHDDEVENRKIAYIINLSKGFANADGGRLQLYDSTNPLQPTRQIIPVFSSLVLFTVSKYSLHAVEEVYTDKKRLTVGGWYY